MSNFQELYCPGQRMLTLAEIDQRQSIEVYIARWVEELDECF